jgi:TonB family protein
MITAMTSRSAALLLLCACIGFLHSASVSAEPADSKTVKVYKLGEHVTAPELMPINFTTVADPVCQGALTGDVEFAAIVDSSGNPRNVFPTRPAGNELDQLASEIVAKDHFKAGEKDGTAIPVSITIDIQFEACRVSETDAYGNVIPKIKLRKQPSQQIGPSNNFEPESVPISTLFGDSDTHLSPAKPHRSTIAPVPISTPEAKYTAEARMKQIQGVCLITLIVNAYGNPQNIRVVRSLGYGLDETAIEAVRSYRFKPAMKDGHPTAIPMTIEVRFRL